MQLIYLLCDTLVIIKCCPILFLRFLNLGNIRINDTLILNVKHVYLLVLADAVNIFVMFKSDAGDTQLFRY
jgi:hypothetical protein